jgi:S-adenosylmethionine:tRNA ribosyltransferase-isomerase
MTPALTAAPSWAAVAEAGLDDEVAGRPAGLDFVLPPDREAHEPPEARGTARDGVRLMVSRTAAAEVSHHRFTDLPRLLLPGDLLVVNTSATLPAALPVTGPSSAAPVLSLPPGATMPDAVHFSTPLPDGQWLIELRRSDAGTTRPCHGGTPGQELGLPAGAVLTLGSRFTERLWRARLSTAVVPYLLRHGTPVRYSYVQRPWPIEWYQTVFGTRPGSAEMPSASRPFTPEVVAALVARGITFAPVTLHTGVSSLEGGEDPYPEPYDVPPATARLVNLTRRHGGRVIAVGTTVVRALETAAHPAAGPRSGAMLAAATRPTLAGSHRVSPSAGWTDHVVTPGSGVQVADALLTGLHEPRSTHLWMLGAFAPAELLSRCYAAAIERGYLWHEFGDLHLLLP